MRARLRALLRRMGEDRLWLGCLLLFGLCAGSYFLLQFLPLEHHTVECALDRRIISFASAPAYMGISGRIRSICPVWSP